MKKFLLFIIILTFFAATGISSQSLDSLRQVAWSGDYAKARKLWLGHKEYPENSDFLFLAGQTFYWENNLSRAREFMNDVLEQTPGHLEAHVVLSSVLVAQREMSEVIRVADRGLELDGDHEELLYNRAFANADQGHLKEARVDLERLLRLNPNHKKALELKDSLEGFKVPGSFGVFQSLQTSNTPFERNLWITTAEAPVGDKNIKIIPRLSFGNLQIDDQKLRGSQAGLDIYPLTGPDSYMYIHYAYSEAEIFPVHRSALEWFQGLLKGWEVSAGGRYLFWNEHNLFFTISASKYAGKWMPGIRLFYAPESNNEITAVASVRKYFHNEKTFIHTYLSYGNNPDRMEQQADLMTDTKTTRMTGGSYTVLKIGGPIYAKLLAEFSTEEYVPGEWRNVLLGQIGLEYKF